MTAVLHGNCLAILPTLPLDSFNSCVTDPPYHLVSIVKRFGKNESAPAQYGNDGRFARASAGFMGKQWDGGDVAARPETWAAVWRVLKPGAHLVAFGGTRTYHRMACAIEDAGFEIRDCIQWLYGSGFPKSHNIGNGLGTALKPACEPIVLARKPLSEGTVAANVLKWGTGAINVDGCRVEASDGYQENAVTQGINTAQTSYEPRRERRTFAPSNVGRWPANVVHDGSDEVVAGFPDSDHARGNTTPTKRNESDGVWAANGSRFGIGQDGETFGGDTGSAARFFYTVKQDDPCEQNVSNAERCSLQCHRQSGDIVQPGAPTPPVLKIVPNVKSAGNLCDSCAIAIAQSLVAMRHGQTPASNQFRDIIGERNAQILSQCLALYAAGRESTDIILTTQSLKQLFGSVFHAIATYTEESDCGQWIAPEGSKRFWYTSKADGDERIGSKHPTVKPIDLMQWLVRLVTPKGGAVLDPFAGTGTTGEAAWREGCRATLIEREAEYLADIARRMELMKAGPDERAREIIKASGKAQGHEDLPLFDRVWADMWAKPFDKPELVWGKK